MSSSRQYHYLAYGVKISSDLSVPEFPVGNTEEKDDFPSVRIRLHAEQAPLAAFAGKPWFFDVTRRQALLYFSGVAVFRLTGGREIDIIPVVDADYRLIELYLSGTVFGVLLHQQGKLVFHAGSVAIQGEGAVLLVGESGAGKSSLATALYCRGHHFLSDDASALFERDDELFVIPAFPLMKVDPELTKYFCLDKEKFRTVHATETKKFYPCRKPFRVHPCRVKALFVLGHGQEASLSPLAAKQAMIEAVRHTVPSRLLHTAGDKLHFSQCAAVAEKVPAFLLHRTSDPAELSGLAELVEQQVQSL